MHVQVEFPSEENGYTLGLRFKKTVTENYINIKNGYFTNLSIQRFRFN